MSDTQEALRQIESTLADLLETYAEMRSEYLRNAPDAHRTPLEIEIAAFKTAARLVREHREDDAVLGVPTWRLHEWAVRAGRIADRLDKFLVIPRTEVRTEYGVRYRIASADVAHHRAEHVYAGKAVPVQRETWTGSWSETPLPDDSRAVRLSKTRQDGRGTLVEDVDLGTFPSLDEAKQAGDRDAGRSLDWGSLCGDGRLWAEPDWSDYNWFISPVPLPEDGAE